MMMLIIAIAVVVCLVVFLVSMYNRLVGLRNKSASAWSTIDVQLKRRHDLIPNLVAAVKGYAAHEKSTFDELASARAAAQGAHTVAEHATAEQALTGAIGKLFAVAEAYPDLKASTNFQQLQVELTATEDRISVARQIYNDTVFTYNTACQVVPTNFIAGLFHFQTREFFELDDAAERNAPEVSFG